jgi:hypothetical protein
VDDSVESPSALDDGGLIVRRQTTFWDCTSESTGALVRVHFLTKHEQHFGGARFDRLIISDEHPVLAVHCQRGADLCIADSVASPEDVIGQIRTIASSQFHGWRSADAYFNPVYSPTRILSEGAGMLVRGPERFVEAVSAYLRGLGVRTSSTSWATRTPNARVALFGSSFVVADGFRVESGGAA